MNATDLIPLKPRDYLILFVLESGERHGYGIVKDVEEESMGQVRLDPANLYRAIKRLMRDGLVEESETTSTADDSERRRYYAITPFGSKVLKLEATRLASLADAARAMGLLSDARTLG